MRDHVRVSDQQTPAPAGATTVIRPATAGDLPGVARIFAHYVATSVVSFEEDPPAVADWHRRLGDVAQAGLPFLVAETGGGAVTGYAYATPWRPKPAYRHTVENSIYLDPAHAGRGIGRALLAALLARCRAAGARQVIAVIADTGDAASVSLHARAGFVPAGRLTAVGHKHGRWVDTLLMQCDLTASVI
jgi:L-amino acid N-acyltransferase YncA